MGKNIKGQTKKSRAIIPYIGSMLYEMVLIIFVPFYFFLTTLSVMIVQPLLWVFWLGFMVVLLAGLLWHLGTEPWTRQGLNLLRDFKRRSFEMCEVRYGNSVIKRYQYFPQGAAGESSRREKKKLKETVFHEVICRAEDNRYLTFFSIGYHGMVREETYRVIYGKYSKILVGIWTASGEKLREFDFLSFEPDFSPTTAASREDFLTGCDGSIFQVRLAWIDMMMAFAGEPLSVLLLLFAIIVGNFHIGIFLFCAILAVVPYTVNIGPRFLPGLRLLADLIFRSFIISEIRYKDNFRDTYHYFPYKEFAISLTPSKIERERSRKNEVFLEVHCEQEGAGELTLYSARFHAMEPAGKYTVVYGKRSRVIVELSSKEGKANEKIWDIPHAVWLEKIRTAFLDKGRKYRGQKGAANK